MKTLDITIFLFLNAHNGSVLVHLFLLDFSTPRIKAAKERKLFQKHSRQPMAEPHRLQETVQGRCQFGEVCPKSGIEDPM